LPGAIGIIVLLFLVNISGIRQSSVMNVIFTIIEATGLALVIYAAFTSIGKVNFLEMPEGGASDIMAAAALAFFAYIGFEEIVKLAEETKNPEKNIPRALFISSFFVIIIYLIVAFCAVSAIPYEQLGKSTSPMADIVETKFGSTGIIIISIIALFATANTILSNMLASSRVLLSMAKQTKILKIFSKVSTKRKTPIPALILILIVMSAFALIGEIETVARIATSFIFVTFIIVNLSVIALRLRDKNLNRPYKIPFSVYNIPLISVFGIIVTLGLLTYDLIKLIGE
jgi:APA family basic amino acid/polyamine antiporter